MGVMMGIMAGGSALFSAVMGGQQQKAQNAAQRAQFEEQEFQRKMQNQIKNRQIAKANAAKWMQNKNIARAANQARAEEEFWLQYNFDNASGDFSRNFTKANEQIKTTLSSRNMSLNSGTSKAILNQALNTGRKGLTDRRISQENAMISAQRKQEQTLAKRDFGYNDQVKFFPGQLVQQSDSSIMQNALTTGLVTGALSGVSAGMAAGQQKESVAAANRAADYAEMNAMLGWYQ
jgi:hypothetical protein